MTNHPGRVRPAAKSPEDRSGLGVNVGKMIGEIVAGAVQDTLQHLPELFAGAMAAVLSRVPVQTVARQLPCAPCALRRKAWNARNALAVEAAEQATVEALAAMAPDNPERARLNPVMFLPPRLQPGGDSSRPDSDPMPEPAAGVIMIGGTLYCDGCAPDEVPQPGRAPLLVAHGALPPGALRG
jgi:hypothetical protein